MGEYLEMKVDKFTFRVREGYRYSEAGVWVAASSEGAAVRLGLTDYLQQSSGDIAFVELPEAGVRLHKSDEVASVETVKVDLEVPAPFDCVVTAANAALRDAPELINQDPYGDGWLVEVQSVSWPPQGLLDAAAYLSVVREQADSGGAR